MRYTDYSKVRELAKNILIDVKKINMLCENLRNEHNKLKGTFLDDGIEEVNSFINTVQGKITESEDSLTEVTKKLLEYAAYLEKGK